MELPPILPSDIISLFNNSSERLVMSQSTENRATQNPAELAIANERYAASPLIFNPDNVPAAAIEKVAAIPESDLLTLFDFLIQSGWEYSIAHLVRLYFFSNVFASNCTPNFQVTLNMQSHAQKYWRTIDQAGDDLFNAIEKKGGELLPNLAWQLYDYGQNNHLSAEQVITRIKFQAKQIQSYLRNNSPQLLAAEGITRPELFMADGKTLKSTATLTKEFNDYNDQVWQFAEKLVQEFLTMSPEEQMAFFNSSWIPVKNR